MIDTSRSSSHQSPPLQTSYSGNEHRTKDAQQPASPLQTGTCTLPSLRDRHFPTDERVHMQLSSQAKDALYQQILFGQKRDDASLAAKMLAEDVAPQGFYLDGLAPIARQLGDLWDEDRISFWDVSVATLRIEKIVHETSDDSIPIAEEGEKHAIFANVPEDEHTIGVKMAAGLLRLNGWTIQLGTNLSYPDLLAKIENSTANILGISIGTRASMHRLYTLVRALRVSRPDMKILVSGPLVEIDEDPIQMLGVDAYATSFAQAEKLLEGFAATAKKAAI